MTSKDSLLLKISREVKAFNSLTDPLNINFGMFQFFIDIHSDRYHLKPYPKSPMPKFVLFVYFLQIFFATLIKYLTNKSQLYIYSANHVEVI
ncbi:hypothetical protein Tery_4345 [Trichodesmium erythraeum IMS101]|uniref:Uncharacterized protein n=1 Tax=Trichodesmium erythraeum (strain IMS101) TaxID=203124 RepID=Q10WN7_TRIEI